MTNPRHTVLYIGVTSYLQSRIHEHKNQNISQFFHGKKNCNKWVYYECFSNIEEAIAGEKAMKEWKREWKNNLVYNINVEWHEEVLKW